MGLGSGIPGSGKNLFRIPEPGVKKAPDPGSGSATLQLSMDEIQQSMDEIQSSMDEIQPLEDEI
jgi:hypothetical protein